MKSNPFDNLPKITKRDALNILKKPIAELKPSADYYKAVFHLEKFPCEESETVLLDFIQSDCDFANGFFDTTFFILVVL